METVNGIIVSCRVINTGYWYSIISNSGKYTFFCKNNRFSLFESCEVVLANKNCSYFLYDYQNSYEDPPLKKYPGNIIAASWFSVLAESLHLNDREELSFIEECADTLSSGKIDGSKLQDIEKLYFSVSGFGEYQEHATLFCECFPGKIRLRNSLLNQLKL
jgi:hypothetical protein